MGKTVALICWLRRETVQGEPAIFWEMPSLIRNLIRPGSDEVLQAAIDTDLLVIDDVGAEYAREDGVGEALFEELIVAREADDARTWISTNLTLPRFEYAVGDRITDRVRGPWATWVSLPGESMRQKPRRQEVHAR